MEWIKKPVVDKNNRYYGECPYCGKRGLVYWIACPYCGKAVERVKDMRRRNVRVRIVETGEEFESVTECAKKKYICKCNIYSVLDDTHRTACGYHFETIDKA